MDLKFASIVVASCKLKTSEKELIKLTEKVSIKSKEVELARGNLLECLVQLVLPCVSTKKTLTREIKINWTKKPKRIKSWS